MKHDDFFRKHPIFTAAEFARHVSSVGDAGPRAAEASLGYHLKTGRLVHVRRGLYAVVSPGTNPDSFPVDPYLVASCLAPDAVISHHSALEFHGVAYSINTRMIYSASRPTAPFTYRSQSFCGTRFPDALVRSGDKFIGVIDAERAGMKLRVTGLERTFVDIMDRPDLSGGWEEVFRSLEAVEFFDLDRVVACALMYDNATTLAKVGFFLELHRDTLMVQESHLKQLQERRPRQPHYLDRTRRTQGRLVSAWNLVVPVEVLEHTWGEVL